MAEEPRKIKLVVVGDGAVGKTSMLISYTKGEFVDDYLPTVFDNYSSQIDVNGKPVILSLWDTAGQEEYERIRPMAYEGVDLFLVCFSTVNRVSFNNVKTVWVDELRHYVKKNLVILLVGTKIDMRECGDEEMKRNAVITEEGHKLAADLGLESYCECSAITQEGLKNVFDTAIKIALLGSKHKKGNKQKSSSSDHSKSKCLLM